MNVIGNLDVLSVAAAIAGTFILGFTVFFSNRKSITNKTFLLLSVVTGLWGLVNFLGYTISNTELALLLLRGVMVLAVLQAFSLFQLFYVFPKTEFKFSKFYKFILIPVVISTAILSSTKYVFHSADEVSPAGNILHIKNGEAMPIFGLVSVGLVVSALYIFIRNLLKAPKEEKKAYLKILIGVSLMFILIIIFNFIFPSFLKNTSYIPFGALFTFPFVILTSYSIYIHKIFNVKVISTAFVSFILSVYSFFNILFANTVSQIVLNAAFFILILVGTITLIKTLLKEIEQKENLAKLNQDLEGLLNQRESLVHLITHKVKASFTRSKYIFAEMVGGGFGALSPELDGMAKKGLTSDDEGIKTIDLVLNAFNLEKGIVKYDMKEMNFKDLVSESFESRKNPAQEKGLKFNLNIEEGEYKILGDKFWLTEVTNNLIENAVRYTISGEVLVGLKKVNNKVIFSVKDTGVGITDEDKKNLFNAGGRGKNSVKVNVDSTGYGLYSVRLIVESHGGRVWAESEGEGKGSTFFVEFDLI